MQLITAIFIQEIFLIVKYKIMCVVPITVNKAKLNIAIVHMIYFNLDRFCAVNPKPVTCSDFAPIIWKAESRNATRATATSCPRKKDSLQRRRKKRLKKRPEKCSEEREHSAFMQRILVTIGRPILHILCLPV
jgi:hypothetical protein